MQKIIIISLAIFICISNYTQTLENNFEASDLSQWAQSDSGHWEVDTLLPINGKGSLHQCFNNTVSGNDMIVLPHKPLYLDSATTSWQFTVRYNYKPSSSNNWSCWLINAPGEDEVFPAKGSTGYVIGVNYTGSDDFIKLWKKADSGTDVVLSTHFNWQQKILPGSIVKLKICRSVIGDWSLMIDTVGASGWISLGKINDRTFTEINDFGLYYEYTSSKDRILWLDDLSISGHFYTDRVPPKIDSVIAADRYNLGVYFNEAIDTQQSFKIVLNQTTNPDSLFWQGNKMLKLKFSSAFLNENKIEINGIADLNGNRAESLSGKFNFHVPQKYDVVISEIMADPSPQVDLPECEYLELYNRSKNTIRLNSWRLYYNDKFVELPDISILPGDYYIITKSSCSYEFDNQIKKITFGSLPALINTGALLRVYDNYNNLIDAVEYSDNWYKSETKKDGGWSLEMIDTKYPCAGKENWGESISETGGTPGKINSVSRNLENTQLPEIMSYSIEVPDKILIDFSKNMDSISVADLRNYTIEPSGLNPGSSKTYGPFYNTAELTFNDDFLTGTTYNLVISGNAISDCLGNTLTKKEIKFGLPEQCDSADLLINEILYESTGYIPEFIEIYNNSEKIFDLNGFKFKLIDETTGNIRNELAPADHQLQVFPKDYIVFTRDKTLLLNAFPATDSQRVFCPESWMALPNDGGIISLSDNEGKTIDKAVFNPGMQFGLLNKTAGVSLERVSFNKPADKPDSWHSASESVGFATPAKQNSEYMDPKSANQNLFSFDPLEISPDDDGQNDFLNINCKFEKPGFMLNIEIFNMGGYLVKKITDNELCGTEEKFIWDGLDSQENKLPMGYYIVYLQAINPGGEVIQKKKAILLLPEKK